MIRGARGRAGRVPAWRVLQSLASVAAALWCGTAEAAPNRPVHVVAEPSSACLDKIAFERALFARITRPRGDGGPDETSVRVRVDADGERFSGRVTVLEPDQEPRERVVRGASCADVALSVVLVAALALGGEPEADPSRPTAREAADDADAIRPPPPPPAARPTPWTRVVGAHGGLGAAGAGETSVSGDLFGEVSTRKSGISPGLRVALGYGTAQRSDSSVTMRVSTWTARLEPSLVRIASGPVAARIVLAWEAGAAHANAAGATRAASATRPWIRAGAQAEIAVDAVGPVGVEAAAAVLAAFVRDEFVVDPTGFGLRTPLLAPVVRLGVFLRLQ